jgi:Zn-finger nucleic acid-binding protein
MSDTELETPGDRKLTCPKCASPMQSVDFHDIHIDRCTKCNGLWFDALEKDHLDQMRDSASIDIGKPASPVAAPAKMDCPVCHTRMIEMVDHLHPTIHFESCKVCYGLFFDAGKYSEHKEQSTMGLFRELFHRRSK